MRRPGQRIFGNLMGVLAAIAVVLLAGVSAAQDNPGPLRLGVRKDCPPFSYYDSASHAYRGFSVDLCREIAKNASAYLDYRGFTYEAVSAQDRFRKLNSTSPDDRIDILCEATTVTQQRMRRFGPTMYTFISGASLMYAPAIDRSPALTVGVLKGTTTEHEIRTILQKQTDIDLNRFGGSFAIEEVDTHTDGLAAFGNETINLYIADREILLALSREAAQAKLPLIVSKNYYTIEPYALFLRIGDHDLRYIANLTLSEIFRKDIHRIFANNFPGTRMNDSLRQLFRLQQLLSGTDPLAGD